METKAYRILKTSSTRKGNSERRKMKIHSAKKYASVTERERRKILINAQIYDFNLNIFESIMRGVVLLQILPSSSLSQLWL
jgi:hypothetical protein